MPTTGAASEIEAGTQFSPVAPHMVQYLVDRIHTLKMTCQKQSEEIQKKNVEITDLKLERSTLLGELALLRQERIIDATLFDMLDLYHQSS